MAEEADYIQSRLFKNSSAVKKRRTQVIYYDCTNFYFEIEASEDDKQFGKSKEIRPLPIVGMGLFMDADGIPISFTVYPGNRNEQLTMIPLEKKMLSDFDMSKFIVCTDSGLSSATNRVFNAYDETDGLRGYITTQSIKKLSAFLQKWCLADDGWILDGDTSGKKYKISELDDERDRDRVFYKTRWIKEEGLVHTDNGDEKQVIEQKLIVSYSIKYRNYLRHVRQRQIERAEELLKSGEKNLSRKKQNDPKRFIKTDHATKDGEAAEFSESYIDQSVIEEEEKYDGFYAVCTNLSDSISTIVNVNRRRWEIEECFRIMKTDFAARPVYVKRKDRIMAHFMTCFIALIVYRYLERKVDNKYTIDQLLETLREMEFLKYEGKGYQPTYTRTDITDALHEAFGFCTSKEIVPIAKMKNICSQTKK
jgi:transposase